MKLKLLALQGAIVMTVTCASAQQPESPPPERSDTGLLGPTSVPAQITADERSRATAAFAGFREFFAGYSRFKDGVQESTGLSFGGDVNLLYQGASRSPGEHHAFGSVFRVYGDWSLVGRETLDDGSLVFKVEHRSSLAGELPPQDLGPEVGYAGLTATTFSDQGWLLTNLYWYQKFAGGRGSFVAGQVDVSDYVDVSSLASPWTAFLNLAFETNPTIPAPSQGLGAAVRWIFDDQYVVIGGLADADGKPDDPLNSADGFFQDGESFKHVAIGWFPTWDRRFDEHVQVTAWQIDDRDEADVDGGWGLDLSISGQVADRWTPFLRAGYADGGGGFLDRSVSLGTAYTIAAGRDLLGIGVNWGRAPDSDRNQYTLEAFYRYQPFPAVQITPNLQLLGNPANDADESQVWVGGLRARIAF